MSKIVTLDMTRKQATSIYAALQQLGQRNLPCWYEIARNTQKCKAIHEETSTLMQDIIDKYAKKDDNGEWKTMPGPQGQQIHDFGEDKEASDAAIAKMEEDTVNVEIRQIDVAEISQEEGLGSLPANMIEPLLDTVIIDNSTPTPDEETEEPVVEEKPEKETAEA